MNDDQLGHDLRAAVEAQTPPPSDPLADIMRRGSRRRLRQHLAAGAVALVVVTGVGTAAAVIGTPTAAPPVATDPNSVDWPARGPSQAPYTTWNPTISPPPVGREILAVPLCRNSDGLGDPKPADPALIERVRTVAAGVAQDFTIGEPLNLGASHLMDVTDGEGSGGLRVYVDTYDGDPVAEAQKRAHVERNCDPPKRTVGPDGTILQLYPVMPSVPFQSLNLGLMILRPDGTLWSITVVNYSTADYEPSQDGGHNRVGVGRETLPLTEAQLAEIGLALVDG